MKSALNLFIVTSLLLGHSLTHAETFIDRKVSGKRLYDSLSAQGVPEPALRRALEFMDKNAGKTIKVKAKFRPKDGDPYIADKDITVQSKNLAIIDFSLPSNRRRLFVIDLENGTVNRYYVAHGKNSGVLNPTKFSNLNNSKMSSLGFYLGGSTYFGGHGNSMSLYGLEKSNDQAVFRDVVMHGADYVSQDFIDANGRLGRSWGCPAVGNGIIEKMLTLFKNGGVIYAYHKDLMSKISTSPTLQELAPKSDETDTDLPNEEEDFQIKRNRPVPKIDDSHPGT